MTATLAFIRMGRFSHTNESVRRQLVRVFPGHRVLDVDVRQLVRRRRVDLVWNAVATVMEYGPSILGSREKMMSRRWSTADMFDRIGKLVRNELATVGDLHFTVQTQSVFDGHVPGVPHFVYTDHTMLTNRQYPDYAGIIEGYSAEWRRREPLVYAAADLVLTMSDHVVRTLTGDYGLDADRVRRVGVGCNAYRDGDLPDVAGRTAADYARREILFVGNNWPLKGGPELVAAFRQVRRVVPDATLTVVGCRPDVDEPGVEVVGPVPLAEVRRYYERASIFCMPTKGDAFGIVFLEAFLNALPVVAWDFGALPDIVEEGVSGHLAPYGDVDALADRLAALLADPARCLAYGLAGRRLVEASYTWDRVGDAMAAVIGEHLASRPGGGAA